ncbi:MAG: aldo/keto reductase [Asgard group archaeon]|nr:aldo/keto reductase [Asgard group archaeon]
MDEIQLPKIGLGTMQGNTKKAKEAFVKAIQMGYRFLDTAQLYFNERVVGKAITESGVARKDLIIASKVFIHNFTYRRVKKSTERSLKRLNLNYVDIMYIHWPFRTYRKRKEKILKAFSELVDEGKIRYLGISNFTIKDIDDALKIYDKQIIVNQVEMHPWLQQKKLLKHLNNNNIKLIAYFPLMHGRINQVPELVKIAMKHKTTAAHVSLAWIINKGAIPIPKSVTESHLKDNFEAQNLVLDEEDIKLIDSIKYEKRFGDFPVIAPKWD